MIIPEMSHYKNKFLGTREMSQQLRVFFLQRIEGYSDCHWEEDPQKRVLDSRHNNGLLGQDGHGVTIV